MGLPILNLPGGHTTNFIFRKLSSRSFQEGSSLARGIDLATGGVFSGSAPTTFFGEVAAFIFGGALAIVFLCRAGPVGHSAARKPVMSERSIGPNVCRAAERHLAGGSRQHPPRLIRRSCPSV